nr:hypothetical protein [Streptomyces endocoffeicus]
MAELSHHVRTPHVPGVGADHQIRVLTCGHAQLVQGDGLVARRRLREPEHHEVCAPQMLVLPSDLGGFRVQVVLGKGAAARVEHRNVEIFQRGRRGLLPVGAIGDATGEKQTEIWSTVM